MTDTTSKIIAPWTGQIIAEQTVEEPERAPIIQVLDCLPVQRFGIIEVADFQDILDKWQDGAVLYVSRIRGAFLVVPIVE